MLQSKTMKHSPDFLLMWCIIALLVVKTTVKQLDL